jgi:hypothetical protein
MPWTFRILLAALAALMFAGCGGGTAAKADGAEKPSVSAQGGSADAEAEGEAGKPAEQGESPAAKPGEKPSAKPGEAAAKPETGKPAAPADQGDLKINIKIYPGAKPWNAEGIDGKIVQKTEFSEFYSNIYTSADSFDKVASWYRTELKGAKEEPAKGEGIEITTFLIENGKDTRIATIEKAGKDPVRITLSRMVQL